MSVTYVRNPQTNEFEPVNPGVATTDTTLSQLGKPADAAAVGSALTGYSPVSHTHTEYVSSDSPVFTSSINMGRKSGSEVGLDSIAIGRDAVATLDYCCAIGDTVSAIGYVAHAEGCETTAQGEFSHAEGYETHSLGMGSHAEGYGTKAYANYAHAEGYNTRTDNDYSHAEGCGTITFDRYQHVEGKYNLVDYDYTYLHVVGNGSSDSKRSNAYTLDEDGNAWYAGTVEGTALIIKSPNGTRFKIAVSDSGTLSAVRL